VAAIAKPGVEVETARSFFLKLFSTRHNSLVRQNQDKAWLKMSRLHFLSDEEMIDGIALQKPAQHAVSVDDKERFLLVEIDGESLDSNPFIWDEVKHCLAGLGINSPKLYATGSSYKLFLYFDKQIKISDFAPMLQRLLDGSGIADGIARVLIPGDSFLLPLSAGFTWLSDSLKPLVQREEMALDAAMALFMRDLTKNRIDADSFLDMMSERVDVIEAAELKSPAVQESCLDNPSDVLETVGAESFAGFNLEQIELVHSEVPLTIDAPDLAVEVPSDETFEICLDSPTTCLDNQEFCPQGLVFDDNAPVQGASDCSVDNIDEPIIFTVSDSPDCSVKENAPVQTETNCLDEGCEGPPIDLSSESARSLGDDQVSELSRTDESEQLNAMAESAADQVEDQQSAPKAKRKKKARRKKRSKAQISVAILDSRKTNNFVQLSLPFSWADSSPPQAEIEPSFRGRPKRAPPPE
jgi:hypothetical protein